jgi:hypothetical protein
MTKAKAKPHTKKKAARKGKPSTSRAARAAKVANACCPVIKWECADKKVLLPKAKWDVTDEGSIHPTYGHVTKCKVKLGTRTFKNLDPAMKDDKVEELKKALTAKRCIAVEAGF